MYTIMVYIYESNPLLHSQTKCFPSQLRVKKVKVEIKSNFLDVK